MCNSDVFLVHFPIKNELSDYITWFIYDVTTGKSNNFVKF